MVQRLFDAKPVNCGVKGRGIDWEPFKKHMQVRLGYLPSLSQKLTRDELDKLGYPVAASGIYSTRQGGYDE